MLCPDALIRTILIEEYSVRSMAMTGLFAAVLTLSPCRLAGETHVAAGEIDGLARPTLVVDTQSLRYAELLALKALPGVDWSVEFGADLLLGDASKARQKLGWVPKVAFKSLAKMMTEADLELARREKVLAEAGFSGPGEEND